jgi:uncharacterized membrane protein
MVFCAMKDQQIQNALSRLMQVGVIVAGVIILAGLVWFLSAHAGAVPGDHVFSGEPKYLENPVTMVQRAFDRHQFGERRSVIMIGVVLLLINPLLRVGFAALGFFAQKDWLYTAVSLVVFAVMLFSFFG